MRHFRYALIFRAPPRVLDSTQVLEIGTFSIPSPIRLARMALPDRGPAYQIEHLQFYFLMFKSVAVFSEKAIRSIRANCFLVAPR